MKAKHIPLYVLVGIANGIIWFFQNTTNEDGEMFPRPAIRTMTIAQRAGAVVGFLSVVWKMVAGVIEEDGVLAGIGLVMVWIVLVMFAISLPEPTVENEVLD